MTGAQHRSSEPFRIAIDPGKEALGWALGRHEIQAAGLIRNVDRKALHQSFASLRLGLPWNEPAEVWMEYMVQYPYQRPDVATAKANDLLNLQFVGGVLVGALAQQLGFGHCKICPIEPSAWNGGAQESVVQARVKAELETEERAALGLHRYPVGLQHNLWDAAGIWLYGAGRLRPGMRRDRPVKGRVSV